MCDLNGCCHVSVERTAFESVFIDSDKTGQLENRPPH